MVALQFGLLPAMNRGTVTHCRQNAGRVRAHGPASSFQNAPDFPRAINISRSIPDVIFDFNGTLLDAAPAILSSRSTALHHSRIMPKTPLTDCPIGQPLPDTLALLNVWEDPGRHGGLAEDFMDICAQEGVRSTNRHPGVAKLLQALSSQGIGLHIATNKRMAPTVMSIDQQGCSRCFGSIFALDMREPRIPGKTDLIDEQMKLEHIDPGAACYVGNQLEDGPSADAQRITFCLARWGYGEDAIFPGHWWRLTQPLDLLELIARRNPFHSAIGK
ncbi:HAD hydrolase-like protein [uncultured Thiodictyon sp.]|uniref:HAD family hydrolase n=1 Tax=uncultured Thiodictyon sp. TaxID=1846217 RepID=UPI0025CF4066|nr:HAD hydrolase-like protein [uncultured Thiodictyon sp.]